MKLFVSVYFVMLVTIQHGCSQDNRSVIEIFRTSKNLSPDYFLFAPKEVLGLCSDSIGMEKFVHSINRSIIRAKATSESDVGEMKILLTLIRNQVSALQAEEPLANKTKQTILKTLEVYIVDFPVSEAFAKERFSSDSELTSCSACQSMYIILAYDPLLYAKVRSIEKGFLEDKMHFPLAYTLQNCDTPLPIRIRMREGLLKVLRSNNDALLKKVYKEIEDCNTNINCD